MEALLKIREIELAEQLIKEDKKRIHDRKSELLAELSIVDKKISEIYHVIEMLDLSASKFTKVNMKLKEVLRQRRDIKTELKVLEYYKTGSTYARIKDGIDKNLDLFNQQAKQSLTNLI